MHIVLIITILIKIIAVMQMIGLLISKRWCLCSFHTNNDIQKVEKWGTYIISRMDAHCTKMKILHEKYGFAIKKVPWIMLCRSYGELPWGIRAMIF
jgi:hypothetical protein